MGIGEGFDAGGGSMNELIHNLPFDEYLKIDALSNSGLKLFARSPAHFKYARENPKESTPAQMLGKHTHSLLLEPGVYPYAIAPQVDRRTKAGKEEWALFQSSLDPSEYVVTCEQHEAASAMANAVLAQPYARALFGSMQPEVTAVFEIDGIKRKARFDIVSGEYAVIVDLKTAADAGYDGFARAAGRYQYHWQAAWYRQAAEACGLGPRPMVFIVVESEPPHGVALYTLDEEALYSAEFRIAQLVEQYKECRDTGKWPGYAVEVEVLSLPKWVL
jgi:hypothetical protein